MQLGFYFSPKSFSKDQYEEAIRRLEAAGEGSPPGRAYHIAFAGPNGVDVSPRSTTSSSARRHSTGGGRSAGSRPVEPRRSE
jgi:hypothetical protein